MYGIGITLSIYVLVQGYVIHLVIVLERADLHLRFHVSQLSREHLCLFLIFVPCIPFFVQMLELKSE
jgi:hypothetical protein